MFLNAGGEEERRSINPQFQYDILSHIEHVAVIQGIESLIHIKSCTGTTLLTFYKYASETYSMKFTILKITRSIQYIKSHCDRKFRFIHANTCMYMKYVCWKCDFFFVIKLRKTLKKTMD